MRSDCLYPLLAFSVDMLTKTQPLSSGVSHICTSILMDPYTAVPVGIIQAFPSLFQLLTVGCDTRLSLPHWCSSRLPLSFHLPASRAELSSHLTHIPSGNIAFHEHILSACKMICFMGKEMHAKLKRSIIMFLEVFFTVI